MRISGFFFARDLALAGLEDRALAKEVVVAWFYRVAAVFNSHGLKLSHNITPGACNAIITPSDH